MVETAATDLLMMFSINGIEGIAAGSLSTLDEGDKLNRQFREGRFFEVEKFSFAWEVEGTEGTDESGAKAFSRWRAAKPGDKEPPTPPYGYKCKPTTVTITRPIDDASPLLFQYCAKRQKFEKAILIKRGMINDRSGMITFLRIEFSNVMITSLDWSDGDVVKESCRFIYRKMKVTYVRRNEDGTAGASSPCEWTDPTPLRQGG
jgi:type VI protein secretion system component Hcp